MWPLKYCKTAVCLLALSLALLGATSSLGQDQDQSQNPDQNDDPTGGIRGTITDASGAAVPGARITVSGGPGPSSETTSDNGGDYALQKLPQGKYDILVSASGYQAFQQNDVEVIADVLELDVTLDPDKDAPPPPQNPNTLGAN